MRHPNKIKEKLLKRSNNHCEYCGVEINENTAMIDHKIPLSKGGTSDINNLAISCPKCSMLKADNILEHMSHPFLEPVVKLWIHSYLKSPALTLIISFLSAITITFSIYQLEESRTKKLENKLSQNLDFKVQIDQLNETEQSLKTLLNFVGSQREKMTQYEQSIKQLESEKEQLEPLVNADKVVVEALFKAQEEKALENANRERWIGFASGVIASIIASFAIMLGKYFIISRRENS